MDTQPSLTTLRKFEFAVVDVETTGLFAGGRDRLVEVAVVRVRSDGQVLDEYSTLLNPGRDLGPTHIHGLSGRDVESAPRFEDIAGDLLHRLAGAVVVAHNARFDVGFLRAEYMRLGVELPLDAHLCTIQLGYAVGRAPPRRRLLDACEHFGIQLDGAHSALGDARAAAQLLSLYLDAALSQGMDGLAEVGCTVLPPPRSQWPQFPVSGRALPRSAALQRRTEATSYLAELVRLLPAAPTTGDEPLVPYLELLDRALEDRRLTAGEAESLHAAAVQWGHSASVITAAHHAYLRSLAVVALADGKVTDAERRDLDAAAALLGLGSADVAHALETARNPASPTQAETLSLGGESLVGKSVCFTGTLSCRVAGELLGRAEAERLAQAAGLRVIKSVSSKLDILVVADPDSLSSKAQKARSLGTRILADTVFFRSIGVMVE